MLGDLELVLLHVLVEELKRAVVAVGPEEAPPSVDLLADRSEFGVLDTGGQVVVKSFDHEAHFRLPFLALSLTQISDSLIPVTEKLFVGEHTSLEFLLDIHVICAQDDSGVKVRNLVALLGDVLHIYGDCY